MFDNFSQLERTQSLVDEMNKFVQDLIEETKLMKLIIVSSKDIFNLKQQSNGLTESIEWKPYTRTQLIEIFKAMLETKNLLHYIHN